MNIAILVAVLSLAVPNQPQDSPIPLVTGKSITPLGRQIEAGSFPVNLALSFDGKHVAVTNAGFRQFLTLLNITDGSVAFRAEFGENREPGKKREGLYHGLAFQPPFGAPGIAGRPMLFVSRGAEGRVISYGVDERGRLEEIAAFAVPGPKPLEGKAPPEVIVAGVAVSGDGKRLYAVDNNTTAESDLKGALHVLELPGGKHLGQIELPGFPYAIAVVTKGPGANRKVYVTSERDGVVSVVDPQLMRRPKDIRTGENPIALLLDREQKRLFVANAGSDTLSVIDTETDTVAQTLLLRPNDLRSLPGATPTGLALSPDEKRLYVTLADMNCVAVIGLPAARLLGFIPVGWYPTSVLASPDGQRLFVANAKGVARRNPNSAPAGEGGKLGQYIQNIIEGTISVIPTAETGNLTRLTRQVIRNNRFAQAKQAGFKNPGIEHVIYIVKENRTYDQVLGDLPRGNGDPKLTLFPREVTPNQHALAERFVLLDNFYCAAEVSADGWNWSTSAMANEYVARNAPYNYSGRGKTYDFEGQNNGVPVDLLGINDVARAPGGYIWDLAAKHNVSFRNYGFFQAFTDPSLRLKTGPLANVIENTPTKKALQQATALDFRQYDNGYADSDAWLVHQTPHPEQKLKFGRFDAPSRFSAWKREFDAYVKNGNLPAFMMVRFGNNHTVGTRPNWPSPRAMVADNDYAVGQLVEAVSRSPYWKKTAIFILEDDAQNGHDHVDAHRSIAFVISPFVKRSTLDSAFYNTASTLRTMELLLGLPPMNQYDAVATPFGFFSAKAENDEPYTAILPAKSILAERNQATAYGAKESAKFSVTVADSVPDELLTTILWHAIKGRNAPQPTIRRGFGSVRLATQQP